MTDTWCFPSSGGGSDDGFNDAGIETFAGKPFETLVREVIQNSLDAEIDSETLVTVFFEFIEIRRYQFPGADALFSILKQCFEESKDSKNKNEIEFFKKAARVLMPNAKSISCLKISDSGTTGLGGDYQNRKGAWHAITKGKGITDKRDMSAGGSFGIGKSAPLTVSQLRTVFYATLHKENGEQVLRAQGKSILKSHSIKDPATGMEAGYTQGTGFYGDPKGCLPMTEEIPDFFRPKKQGAVVFIPGFAANKNWQHSIVAAVVCNYFCAISHGKLRVKICDESGETEIIEKESLEQCFQKVIDSQDGVDEIKRSYHYYRAMQAKPTKSSQLPNLGNCKLWVHEGDELPQKVALLRKTGMLITDDQPGLKRWSGCANFVAVFMCDDEKGNQLLRAMENPQHNAFELERAIVKYKKDCAKALKELVKWVKDSVNEIVKPEETESSEINELSEFFSDLDAPETIPGDSDRDIEGKPFYSLKPLKRAKPVVETDNDGDEGGASEDGEGGGGGDSDGPGEGGGSGGTGTRGTKPTVELRNVRIVSDGINPKNKTLYFTPTTSGRIAVEIAVMGDDGNTEKIALDANGNGFILVDAKQGERTSHAVTLRDIVSDSIAVRAFQQSVKKINDENTAD